MDYDYIIVGAGSAGAALAARLSENPATTVLLLEAGPDYRSAEAPPEMRSPNFLEIILRGGYHWPALYVRLTDAQPPKLYLRGRGAGGSSAINAQGAGRGMPADYDAWAEQGCTGWSWQEVLPFFIRLEDDLDFGDRPYHGRGGPIPIARIPLDQWGAVGRAFLEAALALGHPWCEDGNAPQGTGISPFARMARGGARVSTNDGYLEPARGRANLKIVGNALVERVVFDGTRAVGVRAWTREGPVVYGAGEVILCAGAIHSPAILLRSGIGSPSDLLALGIRPVVNVPSTGQNLSEHPMAGLKLALRPAARAASIRTTPYNCGLRATSGLAGENDLAIFSANVVSIDEGGIWVGVMQPFSRGRLTIHSPDPKVEPSVEFRLLADDRDLQRLRDGVRMAFRLAQHPAFAAVSEGVWAPGLTAQTLAEDASLDEWLRVNCEEFFHAVGTCRMGSADDPRSVVHPDCRVIGVEGLRVADASIVPDPPRAGPHLTTVMIAEHLAARLQGKDVSLKEPLS